VPCLQAFRVYRYRDSNQADHWRCRAGTNADAAATAGSLPGGNSVGWRMPSGRCSLATNAADEPAREPFPGRSAPLRPRAPLLAHHLHRPAWESSSSVDSVAQRNLLTLARSDDLNSTLKPLRVLNPAKSGRNRPNVTTVEERTFLAFAGKSSVWRVVAVSPSERKVAGSNPAGRAFRKAPLGR
jgi:hypothetical protein